MAPPNTSTDSRDDVVQCIDWVDRSRELRDQGPEPGAESVRSKASSDGRWGEQEEGEPVSRSGAMDEFAEMTRELTKLSLHQSKASAGRRRSTVRQSADSENNIHTMDDKDIERGSIDSSTADEFELDQFLRDGQLERRTTLGEPAKKIGVVFRNLTVKGVDASSSFVKTLPDAIKGTFGPDLYHLLGRFIPALRFGKPPPTRSLIHDFNGSLRGGEMMLVLGRPGAGTTTFLKTIANNRSSFVDVLGEVKYGGIGAEYQDKHFRGEVNYNPEDDQHFPSLTVEQTLRFSLMNKTKKKDNETIPIVVNALMKMFGISHTRNTAVGNEFMRGVSGGERKRVGIAETLATKSTVVCFDNSSRGLDASTAVDFAKSLRVMTDVSHRTTFVTLYQAGESIYELMDKVMVIEEGRMLYQGPANQAKAYFEELGFHCPERSTTADFLTSLCDPLVRQFQPGREASTPKTAEELESIFRTSDTYRQILKDVEEFETEVEDSGRADYRQFEKHITQSKSKTVSKRSNYTVSFPRQVLNCAKRELWLFWGDKASLYTKFFIVLAVSLIVGSLFYGQSLDTGGAFPRGGALFFCIIFLGWLQLTELMPAVSGRTIIARHKDYAFYRPSAVVIARVLVDLPIIFAMLVLLAVIEYFLTGLDVDVSKFFIFSLFIYLTTIAITAMYRMFAAFSPTIDDAVRFGGIGLNLLIFYVGYAIPKQALMNDSPWFGWLLYVNPISFAYEAVLANEFSDRIMECSPEHLVPRGPDIDPKYQGCSLPGSELGSNSVSGAKYIETSFDFSRVNMWRNFGIIIAFIIAYVAITAIATELFPFVSGGGGALVFKRSSRSKSAAKAEQKPRPQDEEAGKTEQIGGASVPTTRRSSATAANHNPLSGLATTDRIFTWNDVEYTVPYGNSERKLLNRVSGYVKPGSMIALMGASGSGKTTLLNTLAQRQRIGVVGGDMLVDGRSLPPDFQRGTGFVEQMDIHDMTATIREALEFSAILRQDRNIPRKEKIDYVDQVISMLELEDIQDAIISSLSVEQRKRLTIGVELAARPSLLLFLDEPTSGLDSQAALQLVYFLRKLAEAGQAIICTIHQPSSMLIQQFDTILALNPGGNTFYFGPVGAKGSAVVDYFAARGAVCPPNRNVAEFLLETAAKGRKSNGKGVDWDEEWRNSKELQNLKREIDQICEERRKVPALENAASSQYEYAAPVSVQTWMLTKRVFVNYWRDSSYLYGKLFISVIMGIFNGFTFWQLSNTISSMQNRMFTIFLIILLPPIFMNGILPKFFMNRTLWEAREQPSRIYGWFAFCTANVVAEIPAAVVTSIIYWVLWYYPTGLPTDSSTAGYVFLMTMLFFFFQASWGQWICAFAPSFTVIGNVLPFFFVIINLFNGIMRPYASLPPFWRYWIYYANPVTWWMRGVLSATMSKLPIVCSPAELTHFNPPPLQTCAQYANDFISTVARSGYLTNPEATEDCMYCAFSSGEEYLRTLNVQGDDKWKGFGIFLAFVFINWALVYFMIYTVRIRGWSFGFGLVVGWIEMAIAGVESFFGRLSGGGKGAVSESVSENGDGDGNGNGKKAKEVAVERASE